MCGKHAQATFCFTHDIRSAEEGDKLKTGWIYTGDRDVMGFFTTGNRPERRHVKTGQTLRLSIDIAGGKESIVTFLETTENDFVVTSSGKQIPLCDLGENVVCYVIPTPAPIEVEEKQTRAVRPFVPSAPPVDVQAFA